MTTNKALEVARATKYAKDIFTWVGAQLTSYGEEKAVEELLAYREEILKSERALADKLAEALELISDTDPETGTEWFHDVSNEALAAYNQHREAKS